MTEPFTQEQIAEIVRVARAAADEAVDAAFALIHSILVAEEAGDDA